jgi:Ran GTPase-activating protein (RanGAP) involved in mRNA processing and transport
LWGTRIQERIDMADFPQYFRKGDKTKVAHNQRDVVKLKFDGFKAVDADEVAGATEEATDAKSEVGGQAPEPAPQPAPRPRPQAPKVD